MLVTYSAYVYFEGYDYHGHSFERSYRCYPASLIIEKPHLEAGGKLIMPASALHYLSYLNIDYPMQFELSNVAANRSSHCGVLEFTAEEGLIYMPHWMMENLLLKVGDTVRVRNASLPMGTYVKMQPHNKDFLDISNPKAILETTLRTFSCLTTGDSIMVSYNKKKYYIDIVETKPSFAISIVETDCEVEFAPPLDYKEPERQETPVLRSKAPAEVGEVQVEDEVDHKFTPFTGTGRRLDGNTPEDRASTSASTVKDRGCVAINNVKQSMPSASQSTSRQRKGKLVFGASSTSNNASREPNKAISKEEKVEAAKKEESKVQAFTGKKYSLRD
ncbi:ubiquitin recognition factor in ER-associated degradation protein 1-like [Zingiber officinale]|uniref:ubiquitin recognition factor in ER-associated degradation protein 1-like n=1 Tax=Zingiber officinale TaxID=94328 RepID=UPI001C4C4AB1|nr:ubiquitin recognition factor in ER-associated degradation protein 1-like [Zingiber officinale]